MDLLLFGALFALIFIGLPIVYSLLLATIIYLVVTDLRPLIVVPQRMVVAIDSFPLLAIPMFILMGYILQKANLSSRLIAWLMQILGRVRGALGLVAVVASAILAALTGSGPATVVAIGGLMIPAMVNSGIYSRQEAAGLVTVAGALGPIIPPSIIMILYGATMGVSIPSMFLGGIVPGLILALSLIGYNAWLTRGRSLPPVKPLEESGPLWLTTIQVFPILLIPTVVVGGIYGGIFTPTEAAAIGVASSTLVGLAYRSISVAQMKEALTSTVGTSALIGILIAGAGALSWILSATQLPARVTSVLVPYLGSETIYLLLLLVFLFIVGAIMEPSASVVVLAPILVPIGLALGVDPLHLGVVFCVALVVGYVTPPFGLNLFAAVPVSGLTYGGVVQGLVKPMVIFMAVVVLITFQPWTTTLLVQFTR